MSRYCLQYYSRTRAAIADRKRQQKMPRSRLIFNYPNKVLTIVMRDSLRKIDNVEMHTGLEIFADSEAGSMEEAQSMARDFVETLLTLISFTTMVSCEPAKLLSVLDITQKDAIPARFVTAFSDPKEIQGQIRTMDLSEFDSVFKSYDGMSANPQLERVARAMFWFRKAIIERNTIDRFLCYWLCIEVIDCLLRDRLRFEKKKPNAWEGTDKIFVDKLNFTKFEDIHTARRNIIHGLRDFDNSFIAEINNYLEPMRKGLVFIIGNILGLQDDLLHSIANKTLLRTKDEPWQVLQGEIRGVPADFNSLTKNYPLFELKDIGLHYVLDDEGNPQITLKPTHTFHCHTGGTFYAKRAELWG